MNADKIIDISKYFSSSTFNLNSDKKLQGFLKDFKKNILSMIGCSKNLEWYRLYNLSKNIIYYPNVKINDSSKSVLLVSHELSRTGAPIVVLDTAKVFIKKGYFVTVISLKDGPLLQEFLDIGVPVIIMNDMRYVQYLNSETTHFFDKMDLDVFVNNFDIIFMVTATLYNFVRRYFNTNKRIYWWIHEGSETYNILGSKMPKVITNNIKVICGGNYAVNQLNTNGYIYYPYVLNYGVYDECKKPNYKTNDIITFMLAGTICTRKGQSLLLDAIEKLSYEEFKKTKFIFIGDCYDNDITGYEIKRKIENYSRKYDNIKLLKSVSRNQLYELYKEIDVLVIASYDDPMPVVGTENFMFGNICLVSNCTGTSYYITNKNNGFIFKTGDSDDLKDKISYIINNRDCLSEIRKNGRKIYDNYFTINIFEKNIMKLVKGEML